MLFKKPRSQTYHPLLLAIIFLLQNVYGESPEESDSPSNAPSSGFMAFPTSLIDSANKDNHYYTIVSRLRFDIGATSLKAKLPDSFEILTGAVLAEDGTIDALECTVDGAKFDYINTWFPYTGIFAYGAKIKSVLSGKGKKLPLNKMSWDKDGTLIAKKRKREWGFSGCVGEHRAMYGERLNKFLPWDATLVVEDPEGNQQLIKLKDTLPWVLLRYQAGQMIPVPMRPVIVTIDWEKRVLTMVLQTTFAAEPKVRKYEVRAMLPENKPGKNENIEHFLKRTQAIIEDLATCPVPVEPKEPCADPTRKPKRFIIPK